MKYRRARALPLLTLFFLTAAAVTQACGGPHLTTLAPGVYADAGAAGAAGASEASGTPGDSGAAGAALTTDAGAAGLEAAAGEGGSRPQN